MNEPAQDAIHPDSAELSADKQTGYGKPLWRRLVVSVLRIGIGAYLGLALLLTSCQSRIVYQPSKTLTATPEEAGMACEEVRFTAADGVRLHAWYLPAEQARGTVLVCHGNAGNISGRLATAAIFQRLGLSVLLFDYRGYGLSEGKPTEEGTYLDAAAAWRHLTDERGIDPARIVIFGRSLGGAIATYQAADAPPAALIVESAFTSVVDVGKHYYRFLPVGWLCRFDYATEATIGQVRAPVLVIHSRDDEIIPVAMGRRVFEAAPEPKRFLLIGGGHNNGFLTNQGAYLEGLDAFLDEVLAGGGSGADGQRVRDKKVARWAHKM
ncbi:MAG: alpha/beta hydrolase [Planctomycetota bacterium]